MGGGRWAVDGGRERGRWAVAALMTAINWTLMVSLVIHRYFNQRVDNPKELVPRAVRLRTSRGRTKIATTC